MSHRFKGEGGHERLVKAIRGQEIVDNRDELARKIAKVAKLRIVKKGKRFITQNSDDSDIFFILIGKVSIRINEREVAIREPGNHVG